MCKPRDHRSRCGWKMEVGSLTHVRVHVKESRHSQITVSASVEYAESYPVSLSVLQLQLNFSTSDLLFCLVLYAKHSSSRISSIFTNSPSGFSFHILKWVVCEAHRGSWYLNRNKAEYYLCKEFHCMAHPVNKNILCGTVKQMDKVVFERR